MTKDELILKNAKLIKENNDLRARVEVLERKLYWEKYYEDYKPQMPDRRYEVTCSTNE